MCCKMTRRKTGFQFMPNEIISLIFVECTRDLKEINIAINISHVCQQWRSIALSLPSLWTSFWYTARKRRNPMDIIRPANTRACKLFDLYLRRSQSQLLDLGFDFREVKIDERRLKILKKALPHVARWRHLTILASSKPYCVEKFLLSHFQKLCAPHLQYLAIDTGAMNSYWDVRVDLLPSLFKGGVPNLTFLWMGAIVWKKCLPPLLNITTLLLEDDLSHPSTIVFVWSEFVKILSLPALSNLSLKGRSFSHPRTLDMLRPVVMEKLQHLRVDYRGAHSLLLLLRAPLLQTLALHNIIFIRPTHADVYSFPSLHSLVLNECFISASGAPYVEQMSSEVKNVIISRDCNLHPINFRWPRLEDLTLNLSEIDVKFYMASIEHYAGQSITCRIHRDYLEMWKRAHPIEFAVLHRTCTIKEIPPEKYIKEAIWPPDSDDYFNAHNENDHFAIPQVHGQMEDH